MICDLYKEGFDWLYEYLYQAKSIYHLIMTWAYRAAWAGSAVVLVQSLPFDSRFRILSARYEQCQVSIVAIHIKSTLM